LCSAYPRLSARDAARIAVQLLHAAVPPDPWNNALNLRALGQYEAARRLAEDTLARRRRVLGEDHPKTLTSARNLAADLRALGQHEATHPLDEDTEARRRASGN
jgi:hypothetical protein